MAAMFFTSKPWAKSARMSLDRPFQEPIGAVNSNRVLPSRPRTFQRHKSYRAISTLIPAKLRPSDFLDLSTMTRPNIHLKDDRRKQFNISYKAIVGTNKPFPFETTGFLYFHSPSDGSPIASEVRFRIVKSGKPSDFHSGIDLIHPQGTEWSVRIHKFRRENLKALGEIALKDGLIDKKTLDSSNNLNLRTPTTLLTSFHQPFLIPIARRNPRLCISTGNETKFFHVGCVFVDHRKEAACPKPYSGSIMCAFERSPLPQHRGTNQVAVRVLKVTKPIQLTTPGYDGYISKPIKGEFIRRKGTIWTINADKPSNRALKALLEKAI